MSPRLPDRARSALSRRALLRRGLAGLGGAALDLAGLGGAALDRPELVADARDEPGGLRPRLVELEVGDLAGSGASRRVASPTALELVGLGWEEPARPRLELRASRPDGGWGRWVPAGVVHVGALGSEPDRGSATAGRAAHVGDPAWTGGAQAIEVRAPGRVRGLRLFGITGATAAAAQAARHAGAASGSPAGGGIAADPGQPTIVPRAAWGGNHVRPTRRPSYGVVLAAVVHHTEGSNGYGPHQSAGQVLAVAQFHRDVKGWNDIGYNLLVDRYGQVFEGRAGGLEAAVIGAQAGGFNARTCGIANLGSFGSSGQGSAGLRALAQVLAWKLALHGVAAPGRTSVRSDGGPYTAIPAGHHITIPHVAGHRDVDQTDCPGNALYAQLPALRRQVAGRQGAVARLTLIPAARLARRGRPLALSGTLTLVWADGAAPVPSAPGSSPPMGAAGARGALGAPVAGAPIEIRALGVHGGYVLARTVTGPTGAWQAVVTLRSETVLEAIHRPRPGASSGGTLVRVS